MFEVVRNSLVIADFVSESVRLCSGVFVLFVPIFVPIIGRDRHLGGS